MPYRVARTPGDSRRLVLHPERGLGTSLLIGLGVASASIGGIIAMANPIAGVAVALASTAFSGWIGREAWVSRIELVRDERERRLEVRARAVSGVREVLIPLDDVGDVLVEKNAARLVRLVLRLRTEERVALTPYFAASSTVEEIAAELRDFLTPPGPASARALR